MAPLAAKLVQRALALWPGGVSTVPAVARLVAQGLPLLPHDTSTRPLWAGGMAALLAWGRRSEAAEEAGAWHGRWRVARHV